MRTLAVLVTVAAAIGLLACRPVLGSGKHLAAVAAGALAGLAIVLARSGHAARQ